MCYYKGLRVTRAELIDLLQLEREIQEEYRERMDQAYSGFTYRMIDVIVAGKDCKWKLAEMEWGFRPQYWWTQTEVEKYRQGYRDETGKYHPAVSNLNAKGEELLTNKKTWRESALNRRCLIPATEFYEYRHIYPIGKKGKQLKTAVKYPYRIALKDKSVFMLAGIWQPWTDRNTGELIYCCAIVTTAATSLVAAIHNDKKRMPVILDETLAGEWISDGLSEERISAIATTQYPAEKMIAHTVCRDFLSSQNVTEEFLYTDLPALELV